MRRVRTLWRAVPWWPTARTTPPGASVLFVAFAFVYEAGLLWSATGAASGRPAVGAALGGGAVAALIAATFTWRCARAEYRRDRNVYLFAGAPAVVHVAGYVTVSSRVGGETVTAVVVQTMLLVLVFGTYGRPLVPGWIESLPPDETPDAVDRHMRDWWGFSQLSVSVVLAFGIGVAAGLLRDGSAVASSWFVWLAVTSFLGVAALWGYALAKIRAVGSERRAAAAE